MSIIAEVQRISQAKNDIKTAIEKRGILINSTITIDNYSELINNVPYAVQGKFTPEIDTSVFSISGLPFSPHSIYIVCNDLETEKLDYALVNLCDAKNKRGLGFYYRENVSTGALVKISEESALKTYLDNGYEIDFSKSSAAATKLIVFKAGYTYDYYITGGVIG